MVVRIIIVGNTIYLLYVVIMTADGKPDQTHREDCETRWNERTLT
jgi:hypothetical protein